MADRHRGIVRRFALIAAGLFWSLPTPCDALTVRYSAPRGCPPIETLRASVSEGLGQSPAGGAETLIVDVTPDHSTARLTVLDADGARLGERTVRSTAGDCEALIRAAGLSAGLALAPLRVAPRPRRMPLPAPPVPADTAVESPARSTVEVHGALGGGLALGLHPGLAVQLAGGLYVRRGGWAGGVELWASGAPAWFDAAARGGRVRSGAIGGAVWGCGDRGTLTGCLGALAGIEAHAGLDFTTEAESIGPWVAGGLRVEWRALGDGWGPRAELSVPISRLTLTVDGSPVWTTPAVSGVVGLGGRF